MADEDQERVEDYLELEHFIEELQAGRVAHPPMDLTPSQARIYRMAVLFRSASPEDAEPHPEFIEELRTRLLSLEDEDQHETSLKSFVVELEQEQAKEHQAQEVPQPPISQLKSDQKKEKAVSRRALLTGGAVTAASLAIGTGIGTIIDRTRENNSTTSVKSHIPSTPSPYSSTRMPLVQDDVPTTLHFVTTLAELDNNAVRFVTETIIGYVIRNDDSESTGSEEPIIALSAACTHMGCLVQWQRADRHYHCPCHDGLFTEYGLPTNGRERSRYLSPLPRLETVIQDGKIYVKVPASKP